MLNFELPAFESSLPDGEPMFDIHRFFNDYKLEDRLICQSQRSLGYTGQSIYPRPCMSADKSSDEDRQEQRTDEERIACIMRRTSEYQDQMDIFHAHTDPVFLTASSLTLEERVTKLMERTAVYNSQITSMQGVKRNRYLSNAISIFNTQLVNEKAAWSNASSEKPLALNNQPVLGHAVVLPSPSLSFPTRLWGKNKPIFRISAGVYPAFSPMNSDTDFPVIQDTSRLYRMPAIRELRLQAFHQPEKALPMLPPQLEVSALKSTNVTTGSSQPCSATAHVRSIPLVGSTASFASQKSRDIHVLIDQLEVIVTSSAAKLSNYLRPIVMRLEPAMIQQLRDSRSYLEIEPSSPMLQKSDRPGSVGCAARSGLSATSRSTISENCSLSINANATSDDKLCAILPKPGLLFLDLFRAVLTAQYVIAILQERGSIAYNSNSTPSSPRPSTIANAIQHRTRNVLPLRWTDCHHRKNPSK